MSLLSGFYRNISGDRAIDSESISDVFNGIITDGIFPNYGETFKIIKIISEPAQIQVDIMGNVISEIPPYNACVITTGKAWINSKWVINDDQAILEIGPFDFTINKTRIDAVVIESNRTDRLGSIKIVKGVPSTNGTKPIMINTEDIKQLPIAFITIRADKQMYNPKIPLIIYESDIEYIVGTTQCPYIVSVLKTVDITQLLNEWKLLWNSAIQDINRNQTLFSNYISTLNALVTLWADNQYETIKRQSFGSIYNLLKNAYFNGTSSWSSIKVSIFDTNVCVGHIIVSDFGGGIYQNTALTGNHIMYSCAKIYASTTAVCLGGYDGSNDIRVYHSGSGTYEFLSYRYTTKAVPTLNRTMVVDYTVSGRTNIYIKDYMWLDLTAIYGTGKEPTKEYMDSIFAGTLSKNTIVSQTSGINTVADLLPSAFSNITMYVTNNGNDATGDGTITKPFRTVTKAGSLIPKNLNGYTAVIYIGPGSYGEIMTLSRIVNGYIKIIKNGSGNIITSGINISNVENLEIDLLSADALIINAPTGNGLRVADDSKVYINNASIIINGSSSSCGLLTEYGGVINCNWKTTIKPKYCSFGFRIRYNSELTIIKIASSSCGTGIQVDGTSTVNHCVEEIVGGTTPTDYKEGSVIFYDWRKYKTVIKNPTLLNSWTNDTAYSPAGYYIDGQGIVRLQGTIKGGAVGTSIFSLPIGYRPAATSMFLAISNGALANVKVFPNGDVTLVAGSTLGVSLDRLSFRSV